MNDKEEHGRPARESIASTDANREEVPDAEEIEELHGRDARAPLHDPSSNPFLNLSGEIERHERNLPHWDQSGVWQFVTWRLADSLPQSKLNEWKSERQTWRARHPEPWDATTEEEYHGRFTSRIDKWLDAGYGACVLRDPVCASIVAEAMHHFDGERYQLGAFVVMPNHVHVLFRPAPERDLKEILHSWKSYTSKIINKQLRRTGILWQDEYWDQTIRNQDHWLGRRAYIENNPEMASLKPSEYILRLFSLKEFGEH
jgi:type I restriction enzyme R subunit